MSHKDCEPQDIVIVKQTEVERVNTLLAEESYGINLLASDLLTPAPRAPTNLSVVDTRGTEVDLDWDAPTNLIPDDYTVYVYNQDSATLEQTITGINLTEATVFGLSDETNYEFWVTATKDSIESKESNHITTTTLDVTAPSAPTGLTVVSKTETSISTDWDDNTESDLAGYNIYVDGVKNNSSLISVSDYQITGLSSGTSYNIYVTAVDNSGNESNPSTTITVTTNTAETLSHLSLNGIDQYVNAGLLGTFGAELANPFCIEFRFSSISTNYENFMGVIHSNDAGTAVRNVLEVQHNREGDNFPVADKAQLFLFDDTRTSSSGSLSAYNTNANSALTDGVAHRLSFNCDPINDTIEIYIDGNSLGVTYHLNTDIVDFADFTYDFIFGARNDRGTINFFYEGEMDDIRLWTKNRTQSEIQGDMDSQLDAPNGYATDYPDLFRYYKCNDGGGDILSEEVVGDNASLVGNVNDNMWVDGNL